MEACEQFIIPSKVLIKTLSDDESGMDPAPHHSGHKTGHPNYQNNVLISIVERILPNGNEGWLLVALAYQHESGEEILCSEDDEEELGLQAVQQYEETNR